MQLAKIVRLRWQDVDWERMRFTVHSPKTAHHADAGIRVVPIFPEIYPHLRECFEQAEPGEVYCCPQYVNANQMYRKHILKIIKAAGLTPWPKLFQNLRSTRETELAEEFPAHVVCKWLGNSQPVAMKHYLQVTEEHYARAVQYASPQAAQKAAQYPAAMSCKESQVEPAINRKPRKLRDFASCCNSLQHKKMGATGLEPVTSSL